MKIIQYQDVFDIYRQSQQGAKLLLAESSFTGRDNVVIWTNKSGTKNVLLFK